MSESSAILLLKKNFKIYYMNDLVTVYYPCAYCGEENETSVDSSAGSPQSYIEDCSVCCRPNTLHITILSEGSVNLRVEFEG